jgi:glycosyltransferase involved in cell wall biosynthesis
MKVIIVMPARNVEKTLEKTYNDIPKGIADQIILVDNNSRDRTVDVAKRLGITVFRHPKDRGYGGSQKSLYTEALKASADIVVMLHPDYQYDASLLPELIRPIQQGRCDCVIGSRIRTRRETLEGGMPVYKYIANRFLTFVENIALGTSLSEFHTGFRAFSKRLLETVPYHLNSNNYVFDSQMLIQIIALGFKVLEIQVPTRYFKEASSPNFIESTIYGVSTLWCVIKYLLHRAGWKSSLFEPVFLKDEENRDKDR